MRRVERSLLLILAGTGLLHRQSVALADSPNNPYKVIYERNAFNLKEPQPAPVTQPTTPEPKVNITFTGIAKIGKVKRAYMLTADAKQPGKFNYYDLAEGEKMDGIEVLEIDEGKESVKVKNGFDEATLTFATHGMKGPMIPTVGVNPAAGPGIRPGTPPPPVPGIKTAAVTSTGPVIVGGNNATTANTSNTEYAKSYGNTPSPTVPATSVNQAATSGSRLRTIPTRSLRTPQPAATPQNAQGLSPEEQLITMEANRIDAARRNVILPPTPGLPPPLPGAGDQHEQ
jgi:hypothetical protein